MKPIQPIGLLCLSLVTLQACQPSTSTDADGESPRATAGSPVDGSSIEEPSTPPLEADPFLEPPLVISVAPALPPLTTGELTELNREAKALAQGWFDLAGLNKLIRPPIFSSELQAFQQDTQVTFPSTASFLGRWHNDGGDLQLYYLSIFPTETANEVCVLEYRPGVRVVQEVMLKPIFTLSKATIKEGHLVGARLRTSQPLIRTDEVLTGDAIAMLNALDAEQNVQVFALETQSSLPPGLSQAQNQAAIAALSNTGCIVD